MPHVETLTRCEALALVEADLAAQRVARFAPGNDAIWGAGNWVVCERCRDENDQPCFHSVNYHTGVPYV